MKKAEHHMRSNRIAWVVGLGLLLSVTLPSAGQQDDLRQQLDAAFKKGLAFFRNARYADKDCRVLDRDASPL